MKTTAEYGKALLEEMAAAYDSLNQPCVGDPEFVAREEAKREERLKTLEVKSKFLKQMASVESLVKGLESKPAEEEEKETEGTVPIPNVRNVIKDKVVLGTLIREQIDGQEKLEFNASN